MSTSTANALRKAEHPGQRFFDGRECPHGHGTRRYVASGQCVECAHRRTVAQHIVHKALVEAAKAQRRAAIATYYEARK